MSGLDPLAELRSGGKLALARALARIEAAPLDPATLDLLDAAFAAPRAHVVGLTGPPGVGKSTLLSALVATLRRHGRTVGVIAVDPSSRRSGGALLGDRTRLDVAPEDDGVFVRSMAARDRLGGLAEMCAAASVLMRAVFDTVLIETVGVGQSETTIRDLADTVVLAIQPASGDSLQFMKAGTVEIPDVAVVTKADLGALAERAARDLEAALRVTAGNPGRGCPVLKVSALTGQGLDELVEALEDHEARLRQDGGLTRRRAAQARTWLAEAVREEHGRVGLRRAAALLDAPDVGAPFRRLAGIMRRLERETAAEAGLPQDG